jgi:hypothetical protein
MKEKHPSLVLPPTWAEFKRERTQSQVQEDSDGKEGLLLPLSSAEEEGKEDDSDGEEKGCTRTKATSLPT